MKKLLSILLSASVLMFVIPIVYADSTTNLNLSDSFTDYTIGDNWKTSAPTGWTINSNTATGTITIAADPENANNQVLRLQGPSGSESTGAMKDVLVFQANGGSAYTPDPNKKIILRSKIYIEDADERYKGLPLAGTTSVQDTSIVNGIGINATGTVFSNLFLRMKSGVTTPILYKRTGGAGNNRAYYASADVGITAGEWHEVVHVISTPTDAAHSYKQYIDGVVTEFTLGNGTVTTDLMKNTYTGNASDSKITSFYGITMSLGSAKDTVAGAEPIIYIDDVSIVEVDPTAKLIGADETTGLFDPYAPVTVAFPSEFNDENAALVKKAISVERVLYDESGAKTGTEQVPGTFVVSTVDKQNFAVQSAEGLAYNTDYVVRVTDSVSIFDTNYMTVSDIELPFTTKKAEGAFINLSSGTMNFNGATGLDTAQSITYTMTIDNPTIQEAKMVAAVAAYADSILLNIEFVPVTVDASANKTLDPITVDGLQASATRVALFLFDSTNGTVGRLMQVPDVLSK